MVWPASNDSSPGRVNFWDKAAVARGNGYTADDGDENPGGYHQPGVAQDPAGQSCHGNTPSRCRGTDSANDGVPCLWYGAGGPGCTARAPRPRSRLFVAELQGIEQADQPAQLHALQCDQGQGYCFSAWGCRRSGRSSSRRRRLARAQPVRRRPGHRDAITRGRPASPARAPPPARGRGRPGRGRTAPRARCRRPDPATAAPRPR